MLSRVSGATVDDLANVESIAQQVCEVPYPEPDSSADFAVAVLFGANAAAVEVLRQRPGQPVDLVHHDDVDLAGPDLDQQRLQGWTVDRGARECAVVIVVGDEAPAFVRLTLYIGLAGLALGVERVELDIEVMLGRF